MFETLLLKPIYNSLILIASFIPGHDLGFSVIVLVIILRLALWPLFEKAAASQVLVKKIQPEMERIRKEFQNDQVKQATELVSLYKRNNFNPFSGIGVLFVQIPILIALYQVFLKGASGIDFNLLYDWAKPNFEILNASFLGFFDLSQPSLILSIFSSVTQLAMSFLMAKNSQDQTSKIILWLSPFMTFIVVYKLSSVVALYWSLTTVFSIFQQLIIEKKYAGNNPKA